MKTVDWYFDFVSPFAYLQSRLLHRFEGKAALRPVPVLFAGLLNHWKTVGPAELPAKRLFTYRHCQWLAERIAVPFRMPPKHPFSPLRPLRLAIALGCDRVAIDRIFRAIWVESRNLEDPDEWAAFSEEIGGADLDQAIASEETKGLLRSNTEAAIARGVWGVPTLVVDGQLFWGFDATDFALACVEDGALLSRGEYARIAELPAGSQRRR
jgi:2-hydroxychromene-2-carboxylate isomerase